MYSVNPITGRWEEPRPSPMEGMTDEQKEYEAMQLVNKLDKLQRWVYMEFDICLYPPQSNW